MSPTGMCIPGGEEDGTFAGASLTDFPDLGRVAVGIHHENDIKCLDYYKLVEASHQMPEYVQFCNHPALTDFVKYFKGWSDTTLYQRTLLRANLPGSSPTNMHYDQIFLREGDPSFLTAWIPIGDFDLKGGGLIYLENSVPIARAWEEKWQTAASRLPAEEKSSAFNVTMKGEGAFPTNAGDFAEQHKRRWLVANYEAGDVVFHDGFMIHASLS